MIFHYPGLIVEGGCSASTIRPRKMISAFESLGYEVVLAVGFGKERAESILAIKERIQKDEIFDFIYSESLTLPTLLSEKNHFPSYPFLDFNFFKFCKARGINTGLFYRDIYWRFNELYESKSFFHTLIAKIFYYYDLIKYRDLHTIFLPSVEMANHIPVIDRRVCKELPPGTDSEVELGSNQIQAGAQLKILYVGGFTKAYPMDVMFEAIRQTPFVTLTICTREDEWAEYTEKDKIPGNVEIVHESGVGLIALFQNTDLCSLFFEPQIWRGFAFPYKFFEYISYGKPIISVKDTPPSRIIDELELGWVINYSVPELVVLLTKLHANKEIVSVCSSNVIQASQAFTWKSRAEYVVSTLLE